MIASPSEPAAQPIDGDVGPARLRVALGSPLSWGFLPALSQRIAADVNKIEVSVSEATTAAIIAAVQRGDADVGFVFGAGDQPGLRHETLWREPLMLLLPQAHALAHASAVAAPALRDETFLIAGDAAERGLQAGFLESAIGAAPAEVLIAPVERAILVDLVGRSLGLALAPVSALGMVHHRVAARPIQGAPASVEFRAIWRGSAEDPRRARLLTAAREHAFAWRT
jgi:DNA-binding transcriptional LysR family regulator